MSKDKTVYEMTTAMLLELQAEEDQAEQNANYCLARFAAACEEPCPETLPEHTLRSAELAGVEHISRDELGA